MSTKIEWTDETWNPVTGCDKVSQGCKNCYAERIAERFWGDRKFTDVWVHPERLDTPLWWKKPRRIFVNSMSDLFHESVSNDFILRVWIIMAQTPRHTYQILTKRPDRMISVLNDWLPHAFGLATLNLTLQDRPLPNIWLGVSCEDQATADERIPLLLQTPAAVRFVSLEPLLGEIKLPETWEYMQIDGFENNGPMMTTLGNSYEPDATIDWVIVGGESGPNARPMHPDWVRSIRDQCQEAGVPFFFKQWGEWHYDPKYITGNHRCWMDQDGRFYTSGGSDVDYRFGRLCFDRVGKKAAGRLLDGREWNEFPKEK